MSRPKRTPLDRFLDEFAVMPADERAVTIDQLQMAHRMGVAMEKRLAAPPEPTQPKLTAVEN